MHTTVQWVPQRVPSWVSHTILMAVVLFLLWAELMGGANWWGQIYLLFLWANLMIFWRRRLFVISAGVLLNVQAPVATQAVPLATAEAKRLRTDWYIRWMDGKRPQSLRVKFHPGFDTQLEQAMDLARAPHGPGHGRCRQRTYLRSVRQPDPVRSTGRRPRAQPPPRAAYRVTTVAWRGGHVVS